jgi:hypothetical protein
MKTQRTFVLAIATALAALPPAISAGATAASPAMAAERVGVYDSRALAYAHFWSAAASKERDDAIAAARAAKAAGDRAGFERRSAALAAGQKKIHEQVFGSAPATEALAALEPRLPELRRELGVDRLVSKWDEKALRDVPAAARVDVTDPLVRVFLTPTEKQQKVLDSMKAKPPVPLWRLRLMHLFGSG